MNSKKILLVQLFSNGDCLYATTVARQIKQDFPNCYLTWAITSSCKSIIENNPFVDDVMIVNDVAKDDIIAFRKFKKNVLKQKSEKIFDEIFITQIMDENQAFYDGCIRSNILRGYPFPITVPIKPVLKLKTEEINVASNFANEHNFSKYKNVILFEFAPQSGQLKMTKDIALQISEKLVSDGNTAIVMSSGIKIFHNNPAIIDGSKLNLRETCALTHHCTFLLGTSSGITWLSTSDGAKQLPMVQILNAQTDWVNPISRDFERYHLPSDHVIELIDFDLDKIIKCVCLALENFEEAKLRFNQPIPLHFKTSRKIIYNLLCYLQFNAIGKYIKVNREVYGNNFKLYFEVISAFVVFPFKLIKNLVTKNL